MVFSFICHRFFVINRLAIPERFRRRVSNHARRVPSWSIPIPARPWQSPAQCFKKVRTRLVFVMRSRLGYRLSFIALLTTAILAFAHPVGQATPNPGFPPIKLQGVDGQTYDLANLRGNVVLISFGATWCVPCSTELHALEELRREYAGKPVKFFWVSIESDEQVSNDRLRRYAK